MMQKLCFICWMICFLPSVRTLLLRRPMQYFSYERTHIFSKKSQNSGQSSIFMSLPTSSIVRDLDFEVFKTKLHTDVVYEIIEPLDESSSIILLCDLTIRTHDQITHMMEKHPYILSQWRRFVPKLIASNGNLDTDKYHYHYDIGEKGIVPLSIARIPIDMYGKLDLGRRLVEVHQTASTSEKEKKSKIIVLFLSLDSDDGVVYDNKMAEALITAFQLHHNPLPDLRKETNRSRSKPKPEVPESVQSLAILIPRIHSDTSDEETTAHDNAGKGSSNPLSSEDREKVMKLAQQQLYGRQEENLHTLLGNKEDSTTSVGTIDATEKQQTKEQVQKCIDKVSKINFGTHWSRYLAALPPNLLNPATFTALIRQVASQRGWEVEEFTPSQLASMGCGAFTAVIRANQGSSSSNHTEHESDDRLLKISFQRSSTDNYIKDSSSITGQTNPFKRFASPLSSSSAPKLFYAKEGGASIASHQGSKKPVVLVGKGVCYDTGGLSLKQSKSMVTMKHDMAGASAALGLFYTLDLLGEQLNAECWLALAENNIGPNAYRPDDVVTTVTGETIEVVDTDAEGRMLLVDTLALASRLARPGQDSSSTTPIFGGREEDSPSIIIDFATLTGTSITALTNRYLAAFTNRPEFQTRLLQASETCGERLWTFPAISSDMRKEWKEELASNIADYLQCRQTSEGDHLYAAVLLSHFVQVNTPWVHIDMASAHRPGGLGASSAEYTGVGPRALYAFLQTIGRVGW